MKCLRTEEDDNLMNDTCYQDDPNTVCKADNSGCMNFCDPNDDYGCRLRNEGLDECIAVSDSNNICQCNDMDCADAGGVCSDNL